MGSRAPPRMTLPLSGPDEVVMTSIRRSGVEHRKGVPGSFAALYTAHY